MNSFSNEHSNLLLSKEWLVQIDLTNSTPYLVKFGTSSDSSDLTCFILVTDTRRCWAEVLNGTELARRWRDCNHKESAPYTYDAKSEETWRQDISNLLESAHTLGLFPSIPFEVINSNYSDFAFVLEFETFKWKWETNFLGYKSSAEAISKHLIMPLISLNHLAFASPDPIGEISENSLEKAVDKIGRSAKRTKDVHVKNAITKPRVATAIRRMTAIFNAAPDLPEILTSVEQPLLKLPKATQHPIPLNSMSGIGTNETAASTNLKSLESPASDPPLSKEQMDSATDTDDDPAPANKVATGKISTPPISRPSSSKPSARLIETHVMDLSPKASPVMTDANELRDNPQDSDSSPVRPVKKKPKPSSSNDDESDENVPKQSRSGAPPKRGTRQPIKRGGKRF